MRSSTRFLRFTSAAIGGVGFVAACSQEAPVGPSAMDLVGSSASVIGQAHGVEVCKFGPSGTTTTFSITLQGGGTLYTGSTFTLQALPKGSGCVDGVNRKVVWVAADPNSGQNSVVTITETGLTPGLFLERLIINGSVNGTQDVYPPQMGGSATVNYDVGANFIFFNEGTPLGGSRGCTPGYWKQSQHFDSWPAQYTPGQAFSSVFSNAFPGKSLLYVLGQGGGDINALGRHAVAALLNSANGDVDFGMTPATVISMFNAAAAGGDIEGTKNILAQMNERSCPLN